MQSKHKQERTGEKYLTAYMAIYSLAPIVANYTSKHTSPILAAAISTLFTALILFFILLGLGRLKEIFNREALYPIIGNTLFNIVIPLALIFIGTSRTSAINTTLLHQIELPFAFLICGLIYQEKITSQKLLGGFIILVGTIAVLYNGAFNFNMGDFLIIAGTLFYPFGNHYAKQALALVHPSIILFLRTAMGGAALLILSFLLEGPDTAVFVALKENFVYLLLFGLGTLGIAKLLWFEGLKRLDVSKATAIVIAGPAFSLVFAVLFLREIPTLYQLAGFAVILAGLFILTKQKTETVVEVT